MTLSIHFPKLGVASSNGFTIDTQTNQFYIGSSAIVLTAMEAAIINRLMIVSSVLPKGFTPEDMMRTIGFQSADSFEKFFDTLMQKLSKFPIANEGGTGTVFLEDSITGADLFKKENGCYSFNKDLASFINSDRVISEEKLHAIKFQPTMYQPLECCRR